MEIIRKTIFTNRQRHEIYKRALVEYRGFPGWDCKAGLCYALYRGMIWCRDQGMLRDVIWPKGNPCHSPLLYPEFMLYEPEGGANGWWWPVEDREIREEVMQVLVGFTEPD